MEKKQEKQQPKPAKAGKKILKGASKMQETKLMFMIK